jgi:hypothetical protein
VVGRGSAPSRGEHADPPRQVVKRHPVGTRLRVTGASVSRAWTCFRAGRGALPRDRVCTSRGFFLRYIRCARPVFLGPVRRA